VNTDHLAVTEVYGPVWQGEGSQRGMLAAFIRTADCNLECTWCDTPFTWVYSARKAAKHSRIDLPFNRATTVWKFTPEKILPILQDELHLPSHTLIIVSGGEPMLQAERVDKVLQILAIEGSYRNFAVETAGTIGPEALDQFDYEVAPINWTVSPKLQSSGNALERRYKPDVLHQYDKRGADFKFVVADGFDLTEVGTIQADLNINPCRIWIMPEGITGDEVLRKARIIAPEVLERGWNLTLRDHVLMYNDERQK
jgi:7-carboxy-7-deazaguanine synthase